jgi:hypothetical protein
VDFVKIHLKFELIILIISVKVIFFRSLTQKFWLFARFIDKRIKKHACNIVRYNYKIIFKVSFGIKHKTKT